MTTQKETDMTDTQAPEQIGMAGWIWHGMGSKAVAAYGPWVRHVDHTAALSQRDAVIARLVEALEWYGEQARLARLVHSGGDTGRHALAGDGVKKARAALAESKQGGE